jgi:hypothetical protein
MSESNSDNTNYKTKYGIVGMIDALARNKTMESVLDIRQNNL